MSYLERRRQSDSLKSQTEREIDREKHCVDKKTLKGTIQRWTEKEDYVIIWKEIVPLWADRWLAEWGREGMKKTVWWSRSRSSVPYDKQHAVLLNRLWSRWETAHGGSLRTCENTLPVDQLYSRVFVSLQVCVLTSVLTSWQLTS